MSVPIKVNLGVDSSGRALVIDTRTEAKLRWAEKRLSKIAKAKVSLTIVQGSYRGGAGAAASAGTHDRGGVIDIRVWDLASKRLTVATVVRVLRQAGFIAWLRDKDHGGFDPHIHAIDYGNPWLSADAYDQVLSYEAGRNGLASGGPDYGPTDVAIPKHPRWIRKAIQAPTPPPPKKGALRVDGIDLSRHNTGSFDWLAMSKAGLLFVCLKATEGTTWIDPVYAARLAEIRKHPELTLGAYGYFHIDGKSGAAQMRYLIEHSDLRPGDFVGIDFEANASGANVRATDKERTEFIRDAVEECVRLLGVKPWLYLGRDCHLTDTLGCPVWLARYNNDNEPPSLVRPFKAWFARQFSDGRYGNPSAFLGYRVDLNQIEARTREKAAALLRAHVIQAKTPTPAPPVDDMYAALRDCHFSTLHTATPKQWLTAVRDHMRTDGVISLTENVARGPEVQTLRDTTAWGWYHGSAKHVVSREIVIGWDEATWKRLTASSLRLSDLTYKTAEGKDRAPHWANTVVLKHRKTGVVVVRSAAHLPAGVEGERGVSVFDPHVPAREALYRDALPTWTKHLAHLEEFFEADLVVAAADLNLDLRRADVRAFFNGYFPDWQIGFDLDHATLGPHRVIDGAFVKGAVKVTATTQPKTPHIDHRPVNFTAWLPKAADTPAPLPPPPAPVETPDAPKVPHRPNVAAYLDHMPQAALDSLARVSHPDAKPLAQQILTAHQGLTDLIKE